MRRPTGSQRNVPETKLLNRSTLIEAGPIEPDECRPLSYQINLLTRRMKLVNLTRRMVTAAVRAIYRHRYRLMLIMGGAVTRFVFL